MRALADAGTKPEELDMIIVATETPDYKYPSTACLLQARLGAKNAACFDLSAGCSGFVYALGIGSQSIVSGLYKKILLVGAETLSRIINWTDRNTCVLFGDGAGAVVLAPGEAFKDVKLTMISDRDVLYYERGMETTPFEQKYTKGQPLVMKGKELFRTAVSESAKDINTVLQRNNLKHEDVDFFLLHQANKRIIEGIRNIVGGPEEKYPTVIEKYGNTSSASIPIMLDEMLRDNKIKAGDKVVMSAFGAGFVSAACLWEWEF